MGDGRISAWHSGVRGESATSQQWMRRQQREDKCDADVHDAFDDVSTCMQIAEIEITRACSKVHRLLVLTRVRGYHNFILVCHIVVSTHSATARATSDAAVPSSGPTWLIPG